jgi:Flp pilus assembly pilin Flp
VSAECQRTGKRESGQASVEFVALLPVLAAFLILAAQTVVVGWALWSAGNAARAGARADEVGSDAEAAARRALPGALRGDAVIKDSDGVRVQVRVPALVPGVELPAVAAASRLDESAR